MLVPLTRTTLDRLVPSVATGAQYAYYWGQWQDLLKRLLITGVAMVVVAILGSLLGEGLRLALWIVVFFYWLWEPIARASYRNASYRKYAYGGFWQGRVLDVYVTEEVVGVRETANERGELAIVEDLERRLNLEVGDKTGFKTSIQAPLRRSQQQIKRGDVAQMVVFSDRPNLERIACTSDVYLPRVNLWVSDYPCLQRDTFVEVSQELRSRRGNTRPLSPKKAKLDKRQRSTRRLER